jgi:hypothetical protein
MNFPKDSETGSSSEPYLSINKDKIVLNNKDKDTPSSVTMTSQSIELFGNHLESAPETLLKIDPSGAKFNIPINSDDNIKANILDTNFLDTNFINTETRINCNGLVASLSINTDFLSVNKGSINIPALEEIPTEGKDNTLYLYEKNGVPIFKYIYKGKSYYLPFGTKP